MRRCKYKLVHQQICIFISNDGEFCVIRLVRVERTMTMVTVDGLVEDKKATHDKDVMYF